MRLIPAPYRILALLLLVLACIAAGVVGGLNIESNRRDAVALKETRAGIAAANKESARREALGSAREGSREKIRVVYRTIKEKADENIKTNATAYAACGLDADGLRIWNAANSGDATALHGEPDYTLPAAAAGEIRKPGGFGLKPHRGDGVGGAVPGSAGEAGGVRER